MFSKTTKTNTAKLLEAGVREANLSMGPQFFIIIGMVDLKQI